MWLPKKLRAALKPGCPVLPKVGAKGIVLGLHQPQYIPLPAVLGAGGTLTTRWSMNWVQRLHVLFSGTVWLQQRTGGYVTPPTKLVVVEPPLE